jgi:hypothetical protein
VNSTTNEILTRADPRSQPAPTYEQLQALVVAPDASADIEHWRELFRDGHRADVQAAYAAGYDAAQRDMASDWRSMTEAVVHPERGADRRLRAAESGCRRDAAEHERAFVGRAHNTTDRDRTEVQRATVQLWPSVKLRRSA